jgi:hypothetical protein
MAVQPEEKSASAASETDVKVGTLESISTAVNEGLSSFFGNLGESIAIHPYKFILGTFILTVLCGFGLANFETESRAEKVSKALSDNE